MFSEMVSLLIKHVKIEVLQKSDFVFPPNFCSNRPKNPDKSRQQIANTYRPSSISRRLNGMKKFFTLISIFFPIPFLRQRRILADEI